MIVDGAAYDEGRRVTERLSLDEVERWHDRPGAFLWLGLRMPSQAEAARVTELFRLHPLAERVQGGPPTSSTCPSWGGRSGTRSWSG